MIAMDGDGWSDEEKIENHCAWDMPTLDLPSLLLNMRAEQRCQMREASMRGALQV